MARIKGWTKLNDADLWAAWQAQFDNDQEAIAHAVWIGNRLVKSRAKSTRKKFYGLKDAWIERHQGDLLEGRKVREEGLTCRDCGGAGVILEPEPGANGWAYQGWMEAGAPMDAIPDGWKVGKPCTRCDGTGKYRSWWLYLHVFEVDGQRYSFHSYVEPARLSNEPGDDCETYGGRFTEAELSELALPVSGIIRVLGHVARQRWGLVFSVKRHHGQWVEGW